MRTCGIILLVVVFVFVAVGCGGPFYLANSLSDWYSQQYGASPWLFGNVISAGLYGIVAGFAWWLDEVFVNTYYFWVKDAQPGGDGKGTVYEHKAATSGKKLK